MRYPEKRKRVPADNQGEISNMVQLRAIAADGSVRDCEGMLTAELSELLEHTVDLYSRVGFQAPWISYVAVEGPRWKGRKSWGFAASSQLR
jgi:hypothetical protein